MAPERLTVELLSDTAFSRGEPTAGQVDIDVEHDHLGLPLVSGKTLHGLLRDSWLAMDGSFPQLHDDAAVLLGAAADRTERTILRVGDAGVGDDVTAWVRAAVEREDRPIDPGDVLAALTATRTGTAMDRGSGGPATGTLRDLRVIRCGTRLEASLTWLRQPSHGHRRCLAMAVLGVRHAGLARSRGLGHVRLSLDGDLDATVALARESA